MIKPVARFKTTKFSILTKFKPKKTNKPVPYTEKPVVAYMPGMFLDPEHKNNSLGGFSSMFGNLFNGLFTSDEKVEHKAEQKSIKKEKIEKEEESEILKMYRNAVIHGASQTLQDSIFETLSPKQKSLTEVKKKTEVRTKAKSKVKSKSLTITKTQTKTKIKTSQPYSINKIIEPSKNVFQKTVEYLANAIKVVKNVLNTGLDAIVGIKNNVIYNIENKKRIAESDKLHNARNDFKNKLQEYEYMFDYDDIKPDLSEFSKYKYISLAELIKLTFVLKACIKHQKAINKLKDRYHRGAGSFSSNNDDNNTRIDKLTELPIDIVYKSNISRKDLVLLFNIYVKNSKSIERSIKSFNNISKRFFKRTKSNMEEIFEYKNKWWSWGGRKNPQNRYYT